MRPAITRPEGIGGEAVYPPLKLGFALFVLFVALAVVAVGPAHAATWLRPETSSVTVGETPGGLLAVDIIVEDVTDLASVLFDANDAPGGPSVTGAAVGGWWSGLADYSFDSGPIPGGGGLRVLADLANRPDNSGESGSGAVATLTIDFGGVAPGTYEIALTDTELVDKDAQEIAHQVENLTIIVTETVLWFEQDTVTVEEAPSGSFAINVRVENVTEVASILFDANDAPSGPVVTGATVGGWWSGLADYNFDSGTVPGGLRILADLANRPDNSGESGSGEVAELTIDYGGVAPGTYTITLTNTELVNKDALELPHIVDHLTVVVTQIVAPTLVWVTQPYAHSTTEIRMEALATSPSGVEYQFKRDGTAGAWVGGIWTPGAWQPDGTASDTGLGPNTPHAYSVRARDLTIDQHTTDWLDASDQDVHTLAAVPADPFAGSLPLKINVTWSDNGNAAGTVYELQVKEGTGAYSDQYTGTDAFYTHTGLMGLEPATLYTFHIRAINGDGIPTAYSVEASANCLPLCAYESRGSEMFVVNLVGSEDPEIVSYFWEQVPNGGLPVTLRDWDTSTPEFDAPQWDGVTELTRTQATLRFRLTTNMGLPDEQSEEMDVYIRIPGDVWLDDTVNGFDIALLRQLRPCADFNGDGTVNAFDVSILRVSGITGRYRTVD